MMSSSLCIMYFTNVPSRGIIATGIFMLLVAVWAWRWPGSVAEHDKRIVEGQKIGWFGNKF